MDERDNKELRENHLGRGMTDYQQMEKWTSLGTNRKP